jgi:hypothetical protein
MIRLPIKQLLLNTPAGADSWVNAKDKNGAFNCGIINGRIKAGIKVSSKKPNA